MKRAITLTIAFIAIITASAQRVTYNHDNAKMNQVTVQETGAGTLTPDLYYAVLHNRYKKKANAENKMTFRTAAGISAYQQIEDAEKLDSALVKRAEIEALNVSDRQIDLAWLAESKKIEAKLSDFERNINRIMTVGGSNAQMQLWREYYNKFITAINAIKQAYMPNSQRKKEYLQIYSEISKANETLIKFIVHLNSRAETSRFLAASYNKSDRRSEIATAAMNRWRGAGWSTKPTSGNTLNIWSLGQIKPIEQDKIVKEIQ